MKRACDFHLCLQNIEVKNDYDIYVHYEKGMPRSAVNLSTNQALAAAVASASHKNVHENLMSHVDTALLWMKYPTLSPKII